VVTAAPSTDRFIAVVRRPASALAGHCELTFLERTAMSFARLEGQHAAYRDALAAAGADVVALDAIDALPDSVFVEDVAVVLDELAVLTRPGAVSRQPEIDRIEFAIARRRAIVERIRAPGTLEGGDVLRIGYRLFVGLTTRTNREGVAQLAAIVQPHGYAVVAVPVVGSLHLKTACTALDAQTLLLNPAWLVDGIDAAPFAGFKTIAVHADEPFAANVLPVGANLIANAAFPRTLERVSAHAQRAGLDVVPVDISEFGKAEAGLTCMSLVFADRSKGGA
jgi:dimethylargininase